MAKDVLLRCIFDSLSVFGENTKASLLANLQQEGVGFTPDTFDIDKFSAVVHDLLGNSGDFIFLKILDQTTKSICLTPEQERISERAYHHMSSSGMLRVLFDIAK